MPTGLCVVTAWYQATTVVVDSEKVSLCSADRRRRSNEEAISTATIAVKSKLVSRSSRETNTIS